LTISDQIARALGHGTRVAESPLIYGVSDLLPEEQPFVERAVDKRRREFATGRVLARHLLAELGFRGHPIAQGTDRAPIWPEGVVGSISHTIDLCIVTVARSSDAISIGVDVEKRAPLKDALHPMVLRSAEAERLSHLSAAERGETAMLIFSAKECAYKCQYPLSRIVLEFSDVEIELRADRAGGGTFSAHVLREEAKREIEGVYFLTEHAIVTAAILPRSSCP
jgi:4'-phosphopantetheinyl transferase EntD